MYAKPGGLGQLVATGPQIYGEGGAGRLEGELFISIPGTADALLRPASFVWAGSPWGIVRYVFGGVLYDHVNKVYSAPILQREVVTIEQYQAAGGLFTQEVRTPLTEPLYEYTRRAGTYIEVNGTTVVSPVDGKTYLVADTFSVIIPPWARAPEPITIEGPLTTWSPPGVTQTWPAVAGYVVTSSQAHPTNAAAAWAREWNAGALALGSLIRIRGYPIEVRNRPGIVPISYDVLEAGTAPVDDPWTVPIPVTPVPPPVEPLPPWEPPEWEPPEWEPPPEPGEAPPEVDPPVEPNGFEPPPSEPDPWEADPTLPPPAEPGEPGPLLPGLGGKTGLVILGLLLLPLFFGKGRK